MASAINRVAHAQSGVSKKNWTTGDVDGGQCCDYKHDNDDRATLESLSPSHGDGLGFLAEHRDHEQFCVFVSSIVANILQRMVSEGTGVGAFAGRGHFQGLARSVAQEAFGVGKSRVTMDARRTSRQ